jgi:hypothetical protein
MVLRRQGQLISVDGRSSKKNAPLASPRGDPSVDPNSNRMQTPRASTALTPAKSREDASMLHSSKAASNVAVKSMKVGKSGGVGLSPRRAGHDGVGLSPRRVGQDLDPKILQMANRAASLRPPTSRSDISATDAALSVLRGPASSKGDSAINQLPDGSQKQKTAPQPPLPPHVAPPAHAHRKPNVRDRKNEGV